MHTGIESGWWELPVVQIEPSGINLGFLGCINKLDLTWWIFPQWCRKSNFALRRVNSSETHFDTLIHRGWTNWRVRLKVWCALKRPGLESMLSALVFSWNKLTSELNFQKPNLKIKNPTMYTCVSHSYTVFSVAVSEKTPAPASPNFTLQWLGGRWVFIHLYLCTLSICALITVFFCRFSRNSVQVCSTFGGRPALW